ncbi:hypothetical protein H6F44_00055 [Pseudanabaena sp. FACHB-1277]|jgi:hypothetical protein|uniref:Uncharacterized protein n=1 Tax=Pseudanabaena cinerea FACHB-1277 TaxID=2949581 RepID=A0A926UPB6_9CYAN|nr:COP23 domain-containing protein [Pseudanabaena cinerea]MBD2148532.1 hypothetical protein [Pseudanabaena cinerea FACHB-1277]
MKICFKVLNTGFLTLALVMGNQIADQSVNAQSKTKFVCGTDQGKPATLAVMPDGTEAPIIRYSSGAFEGAGFSNQRRCEEISSRFQYFNDLREIDFMTIGRINGQSVICVTRSEGGDCSRDLKSEGLLITVRPGVNPRVTLEELINVRLQAGSALEENEARPYVNTQCLIEAGSSQGAYESCAKGAARLSGSASFVKKVAPSTPVAAPTSTNKPRLW